MKKILRHVFVDNLDFTLASLIYVAAHVIDYLFTAPGIRGTGYSEGNPIIRWYIDRLGIKGGLLGYKLIVCAAIIAGMKAVDLILEKENSKSRIRLKVEYILYGGAILTTSGGALWLLF